MKEYRRRSFWEVKADNALFIIDSDEAAQRFSDLRKNTRNKAFKRTNLSWVEFKRKHDPYQSETTL